MFRDHYYLLYSIANKLFFTGFLCFLSVASVAQNAGLKLTIDRPDARYQVGETIQIRVEGRDGVADYRIWQDERTPIFASGTVRITNGLGTINYVADRPDLLLCQISQNNQIADIAFTVDPFDIEAFTNEPADFDEFWDAAKAELRQVPMNPQVRFHSSDNHSTTYRINLGNINNRRVYGYLSLPKGSGPFPAMIVLPPYGLTPNLVMPRKNVARDVGFIALALSIHNAEPDTRDPQSYMPNDIQDPYNNYYRQALMGIIQSINYLHTRNDFNGDLVVSGVSQGAGLAVMTAGLDERVDFLAYSGVTHGQHHGINFDRVSGFPYYLHQVRELSMASKQAAENASKYYENIFFARRFKGISLATIGYLDDVTHAATQMAVYNALGGEKTLIHGKEVYHTHPTPYWRMRYEMMLRLFPEARNFAWQFATTNTAYELQVDSIFEAAVDRPIAIAASYLWNGSPVEASAVEWIFEDENITLTNLNSLTPSIRFAAEGVYKLRLRIHDYQFVDDEQVYYTSEKEIRVRVGEGSMDSNLSVDCPNDLIVNLAIGADEGVVTWEAPSINSTCALGAASVEQISGPTSGDVLAAGIYDLQYLAKNPCGDSLQCRFQLEVVFTAPEMGYCDNSGEQPWQEWIEEVTLNDLQLFSRKEGYGDFTGYQATLAPDSAYLMSLQIGYSYMDTTEFVAAYIDFNQDSTFEQSERVLSSSFTRTSTRPGSQMLQTTIFTPPYARLGATRMRVLLSRAEIPMPCAPVAFGEVEDYTILFAEPTSADSNLTNTNEQQQANVLKVFPNPARTQVQVRFQTFASRTMTYRIFDALGQVVLDGQSSIPIGENEWTIDIHQLAAGAYVLQLIDRNAPLVSERFVKVD